MMKGMRPMIDANAFLLMLVYILCSILLVTLIVLVIKLINTVNRLNGIIDEVNIKIAKFDKMFRIVDVITDNMASVSDKMVDGISALMRKLFYKKRKGKEEENYE